MENQSYIIRDAVIMTSDPVPNVSIEDMRDIIARIDTEQD